MGVLEASLAPVGPVWLLTLCIGSLMRLGVEWDMAISLPTSIAWEGQQPAVHPQSWHMSA